MQELAQRLAAKITQKLRHSTAGGVVACHFAWMQWRADFTQKKAISENKRKIFSNFVQLLFI